jgi:hypothetical protein
MIGATYDQLHFNPSDLNIAASQQNTSPAYPNLTGGCGFGGFIDYRIFDRWSLKASYTAITIKNLVATDSPAGTDGGFDLSQNMISVDLNYYLLHQLSNGAGHFLYIGASAGSPLSNDITLRNGNQVTHYEIQKTTAFGGQTGLGIYFGRFVVLAQVRYLSHKIPSVRTATGAYLTHQSGSTQRTPIDYSGVTTTVGVAVSF